jgi:hypothetical protein
MITIVIAATLLATPVEPSRDATCLGAPLRLETDNVPIGNGVPTSVINTWAFAKSTAGSPIIWLYKNKIGNYYAQVNNRADAAPISGLPIANRLLVRPIHSSLYALVSITPAELISVENKLFAQGFVRLSCFSHDLEVKT